MKNKFNAILFWISFVPYVLLAAESLKTYHTVHRFSAKRIMDWKPIQRPLLLLFSDFGTYLQPV